jgi:hypothetical protein
MGGIFSPPPPTVIQAPSSQTASGSQEVKPYAPVVPLIQRYLPRMEAEFTAQPRVYAPSLVPSESIEAQQARQVYSNIAGQTGAYGRQYADIAGRELAMASSPYDPIYQQQVAAIQPRLQQLGQLTGQAQQRAMQTGLDPIAQAQLAATQPYLGQVGQLASMEQARAMGGYDPITQARMAGVGQQVGALGGLQQMALGRAGQSGADPIALASMAAAAPQLGAFGALQQQAMQQAMASPMADPLYQAEVGQIARQARQMTERDKQLAQQQAIEAGQYGVGSTALGELQELQRQTREETAQSALAGALGSAEQRRAQAFGRAQDVTRQLFEGGQIGAQALTAAEQRRQAAMAQAAQLSPQLLQTQQIPAAALAEEEARRIGAAERATQLQQNLLAARGIGAEALGGAEQRRLAAVQSAAELGGQLAQAGQLPAQALQEAELRRQAALQRGMGIQQAGLQAGIGQASLLEGLGQTVEQRQAAQLADEARRYQQGQEAYRQQLVNYANLLGGLAGLGTSVGYQSQAAGVQPFVVGGGPSPFSQIMNAAGTIAGIAKMSDIRLKKDIKRIGKLPSGINLYTWKWNDLGKKLAKGTLEIGVLAQEVQLIKPEAVITRPDGYLMVNYGSL